MREGVVVMKKAVDFAIKNWRPLVLAYAIIAVAVFGLMIRRFTER